MNKKKIGLVVLGLVLCVSITSAAVLTYYGQIITTATVHQAIYLDGKPYFKDVTEVFDLIPPKVILTPHSLESKAGNSITMQFNTEITNSSGLPDSEGIDVSYLNSTDYNKPVTTVGTYPITVIVEDTGEWIQWTFDMDPVSGTNDKLAGQVVISFDGVKPAFQIHNNDGVVIPDCPMGTWLYCPFDPIIGWGTVGDPAWNTEVTELPWVEAEGTMYDNVEGKLVVRIQKTELDSTFYWAVAGSRYYSDPRGTFVYPEGFNWLTGFESATILEPIFQPFTLVGGGRLDFYIRYEFQPNTTPEETYTITTEVQPA